VIETRRCIGNVSLAIVAQRFATVGRFDAGQFVGPLLDTFGDTAKKLGPLGSLHGTPWSVIEGLSR